MCELLFLFLGGVTADRPFDDRERVSDTLAALWPASAPPVLAGLYHPDAEVRHRCERLIDKKVGGRWRSARRVVESPQAVIDLVAPTFSSRPMSTDREDVAFLALVDLCGLIDWQHETVARAWDCRYTAWLRARAVRAGSSRDDLTRLPFLELMEKAGVVPDR